MANPLLLYNLAPIVNPSFESSADGVFPTGWNDGTSGTAETDTAYYHKRGSREGVKSFKVQGGGGLGFVNQNVAAWHPGVGKKIAWVGVANCDTAAPGNDFTLSIEEHNSGSVVGSPTAGSFQASVVAAGAGTWNVFVLQRTLVESAANGIRLGISCSSSDASMFWFDYFLMGQVIDFPTPEAAQIDLDPVWPSQINRGGGSYEHVSIADPFTEIKITFPWNLPGSAFETDVLGMLEHVYRTPGPIALWLDRASGTNAGRHFGTCLLAEGWPERIRQGSPRYLSQLELVAPLEAIGL